jgi:hypothetical protein
MTVRFEAAFICGYALALLGTAWGLWRVGHVNNDPWSSRVLAGHRRQTRTVPHVPQAHWPHSEAPQLYTGLALVAAGAATLLCIAEAIRHHAPAEIVVLVAVALLGLLSMTRLARRLGATTRG